MVDEILGQQQVVIKSMEQNFRKIEGVAGATILGDGTVGFILDVRGLLNIARQGTAKAA
jgi:two-component system chemotaxis sensor kinase CheA